MDDKEEPHRFIFGRMLLLEILSILKITKIAFLIYVDQKSIRLKLQVVVYYLKQPVVT